jgi:hypothetical protein
MTPNLPNLPMKWSNSSKLQRVRWPWPLILMVFLGLLVPAELVAQQPSERQARQFRELVRGAQQDYSEELYEESLVKLKRAREIADVADLTYNLARTLLKLNRCREAVDELDQYQSREDISARDRRLASNMSDEVDACLATIIVQCQPNDAALTLSDRSDVECDQPIDLDPGRYRLSVTAPGRIGYSMVVELGRGETELIDVALEPRAELESSRDDLTWMGYTGWSALGVSLGLVGGGVWMDLRAEERLTQMRRAGAVGNVSALRRLEAEASDEATAGSLLYAGAGALAIGGTILLISDSFDEKNIDDGSTEVTIGWTGQGVVLSTQW